MTEEAGTRFTALVLAGRRSADDPVARMYTVPHKWLAEIGGVPMLQRVTEALAASDDVGRLAVATDEHGFDHDIPALDALRDAGRLIMTNSGSSPARTILAAAETLPVPFPLLITTADHPLLTSAMIDRFCRDARAAEVDVTIAMTPMSCVLEAYPESRRTVFRFSDDDYTGSNIFAVFNPSGLRAVRFWCRVEQQRKRPWRVLRALGVVLLVSYVFRRLTLDAAIEGAGRRMGARVGAVVLPFPEAAIDVDKPADVELAERILRERGGGRGGDVAVRPRADQPLGTG